MANRETVVKGLELCNNHQYRDCTECPYNDGTLVCADALMRDALELLKEQDAVEPKYIDGKRNHFILCGNCNTDLMRGMKYCSYCGRAVKWDE